MVLFIIFSVLYYKYYCTFCHTKPSILSVDLNASQPYKTDLVVCMWYDEAIREYGDLTASINKKFCERFGYSFVKDDTRRLPNRHPSWEKLALVATLLKTHSTVMWIDADACLFEENHNTLAAVLNQSTKDAVFSRDCCPCICLKGSTQHPFNAGIFIMHATQRMQMLLADWIAVDTNHRDGLWEQTAFLKIWDKRKSEISDMIDVVHFGVLQKFRLDRGVGCASHPKALALHLAGFSKQERVNVFKQIKQRNS